MATQSTNRHREAQSKRHAQACMLLERAYQKAMCEDLDEKSRIRYMQIYLSKTLPDLKAVEHSGETTQHVTGVELTVVRQ